jgi:hypothetical protein
MAGLTRDDLAQIEAFRATATPEEAGKFAAELYKLRNTPGSGTFGGFPRWLVVCIAVWLALLETSDKLPQLLLSYPRYQAALAEVQAKIMQPDLIQAQLDKARFDATAARYAADAAPAQPALVAAQLKKATAEGDVANDLTRQQLLKTTNETRASALQPDLTALQLEKAKYETLAALFQPKTAETQLAKLGIETKAAGIQLPLTEQGAALSSATLGVMSPLMMRLLGIAQGALSPTEASSSQAPLQPAQQPQRSADYQRGMDWRDKWESYFAGLSGDAQAGADWWASVRSEQRQHSCNEGRGAISADFRTGCLGAKKILDPADEWRTKVPEFKAGWNYKP